MVSTHIAPCHDKDASECTVRMGVVDELLRVCLSMQGEVLTVLEG